MPDFSSAKLTIEGKKDIDKILTVFQTRIDFYGKVQDQYGKPVAGANVYYSAADQYFGDSSKYKGESGPDGSFSIKGIKGAGLYVEVSKDGYDRIPDQSYGGFAYGVPSGRPPPTAHEPAQFVLRKKAIADPLIVINNRQFKVPNGGRPLEIDLRTGRQAHANEGDLRIERWEDEKNRGARQKFSWKCRISVPGGGLVERDKNFDFQAPADGYQEAIEIDQPATLEVKWQSAKEVQYFVQLKDRTFARVSLELHAGYTNFLLLECYLNPSGSQNLEYDPAKKAAVR